MMAGESFWNNRERAQQTIDESNSLRNKIEPLLAAEKQLADFGTSSNLGRPNPKPPNCNCRRKWNATSPNFLRISTRTN